MAVSRIVGAVPCLLLLLAAASLPSPCAAGESLPPSFAERNSRFPELRIW